MIWLTVRQALHSLRQFARASCWWSPLRPPRSMVDWIVVGALAGLAAKAIVSIVARML